MMTNPLKVLRRIRMPENTTQKITDIFRGPLPSLPERPYVRVKAETRLE